MTTIERRLLILDDDPDVGIIIGLIAEGAGFEWRATESHVNFFNEIESWSPTHLAIDLVMPEMDGVQVMRRLSEMGCDARIVITSGVGSRVMDAAMRSGMEHGLDVRGVVPKPFSALTLRVLLLDEPDDWPTAVDVRRAEEQTRQSSEAATRGIWMEDLRRALERREFSMEYQPKICCATGSLAGLEALVRWAHPLAAAQMPDKFIHLMEQSNLIEDLMADVFQQSISWFATHFSDSKVTLSINISARNLVEYRFVDRVLDLCRKHAVEPNRIIFELSETSAMENPTTTLDALTRFRMKGFQLSIDDFGTGFSSMVQLVRLPFSEIKVDQSFVSSAAESPESRTVVKSIVDLGRSMGLRTIAEGVEDQQTFQYLKSIGCDLAQGYHIARPMSGDKVMEWIEMKWGALV